MCIRDRYSWGLITVRAHSQTDLPATSVPQVEQADDLELIPDVHTNNGVGLIELTEGKPDSQAPEEHRTSCMSAVRGAFNVWVRTPQTIALLLALGIGVISPVRGLFFGGSAPLGFIPGGLRTLGLAAIALNTIVLAAGLCRAAGVPQLGIEAAAGPRLRLSKVAMGLICAVKLVLTPMVAVACTIGLVKAGLFGDPAQMDPLFLFVLLVEPGMPSAQNLVVLYNNEGFADGATVLSSVYIVQYMLAIASMSFWVFLALTTVETLIPV
eukprot:TRINITY_DN8880_c0_g1_i7.p1 TRINITY_DN8880_c0_g1~~TRINITY_DN8880_c0_g1_i7.p1  ORF type:complete len:268 (+),score=62.99 TRINITY_DN8880_c0_g1_i7:81-884(+)